MDQILINLIFMHVFRDSIELSQITGPVAILLITIAKASIRLTQCVRAKSFLRFGWRDDSIIITDLDVGSAVLLRIRAEVEVKPLLLML